MEYKSKANSTKASIIIQISCHKASTATGDIITKGGSLQPEVYLQKMGGGESSDLQDEVSPGPFPVSPGQGFTNRTGTPSSIMLSSEIFKSSYSTKMQLELIVSDVLPHLPVAFSLPLIQPPFPPYASIFSFCACKNWLMMLAKATQNIFYMKNYGISAECYRIWTG